MLLQKEEDLRRLHPGESSSTMVLLVTTACRAVDSPVPANEWSGREGV